ncbi:hypothetical protein [Clostridium saccharoperbutylacetonicum]|uniref:hypothetical protein n=1 Tax=Clostridium saccharoperbutylacetonicum TaxID=36745 RepID=UPI000983BEBE|nr:hypothetical protein [Clostridium saccharoperbutylacetonicum]AQR93858.1 hypothetical protein CLSAP_11650 [Clostridium saccharoperbutylacetonicum]NSB29558.1 ATP-dependent protease ClpP protease subunit [Clostridium saccharoperbutylacetonicum]
MIRKLILSTVLLLSIVMVSCTQKANDTTTSKADSNTTVEQNKDNSNATKSDDTQSKSEPKVNKIKINIYSIDENSLEPNQSSNIEVNENSTLEDKLKQLSKALSEKKFDNLPIEVKSIDTVNGKKVATINLADANNKKWISKFQGSTGGSVTSGTLIENFLQSNNKSRGEWIDGVKFLYNNEKIEYEHVSNLSEVQYRN